MAEEDPEPREVPEQRTFGVTDRVWARAFKIGLPIVAIRIGYDWLLCRLDAQHRLGYEAACCILPMFPDLLVLDFLVRLSREARTILWMVALVITGPIYALPFAHAIGRRKPHRPRPGDHP